MCPQQTNPATRNPSRLRTRNPSSSTVPRTTSSHSHQHTMWDYIRPVLQNPFRNPAQPILQMPAAPNQTPLTQDNSVQTLTLTPHAVGAPPIHAQTQMETDSEAPVTYQTSLTTDRRNDPWGDTWAIPTKVHTLRVASKNTGTINPQNLYMQAITQELLHLSVSVFAAQETNIHWDPLTWYQIYQQCKGKASQIKLTTASSQEPAEDWYKPGGTLLLTLDPWTSRIVSHGSDTLLGRWTYQEFIGKNDKHVIVVSGYRVCNQKFDAASNTVSAQQTRLLQAQGIIKPIPRKLFLVDLIEQIKTWRQINKEVILCIDANEPVDDSRSAVSKLFTTDLVDLHHHQHPGLRKPPTHQRGSQAIDLIAGSPLVASALLHAWMHPFGDPAAIKGNHRLLGVDLDPDVLFGITECTMYQQPVRGLNSCHPQKVTKFCKQVVELCNQSHLAERIAALQALTTLTPQHLEELEAIDTRLTQILLRADKACIPPNTSPWSLELNQAYLRHRLWSLELTAKRTQRDMSAVLNAIRQRLHPSPVDTQETMRSLSVNLRNAQKALRKAKKEAALLRKQHLEAVLNEARASNKTKKSKAVQYLISAEQNRRCYAAFRQTTKPRAPGGLAYITVPAGDNPPTTLLDKDDMDQILLEYSRTHFATAQGLPFTIEPLAHLLAYDGLTTFGNRILQGRVDLTKLPIDESTCALLLNMHDKANPLAPRTHPLIYEELQNGIKKWPEKTTTSPSGRHLGIYKSLQRHVLTQEEKDTLPPTQAAAPLKEGRDVLFLVFDIMSLALVHTYTLERWKTVWTLFIEKELGNPDINKLRCIMLFEADWQLLLKWHSPYGFLPKSKATGTLTPAQGGGRKGRSAIDQATQQVIKTELIKLNQKSALNLFLDARWCFDLMVEACHNMACRHHGAADDYLRLHAQTHRTMKYYVWHKYGVSKDYNTFDQHPLVDFPTTINASTSHSDMLPIVEYPTSLAR